MFLSLEILLVESWPQSDCYWKTCSRDYWLNSMSFAPLSLETLWKHTSSDSPFPWNCVEAHFFWQLEFLQWKTKVTCSVLIWQRQEQVGFKYGCSDGFLLLIGGKSYWYCRTVLNVARTQAVWKDFVLYICVLQFGNLTFCFWFQNSVMGVHSIGRYSRMQL